MEGSLKMFDTVLNMSSKKYEPNIGTTNSAKAIHAKALLLNMALRPI
jgi:hypothetical protein